MEDKPTVAGSESWQTMKDKTEGREIVNVYTNVIRFQPLEDQYKRGSDWALGDFTKVFSDGSKADATLRERLRFLEFPEDYINKQPEFPTL